MPPHIAREEREPFRILVLGDFRGQRAPVGGDVGANLARRRPIAVDRDSLDDVMARLGVRCDAAIGDDEGHVVSLAFHRLDDFHPDHLFATTPLFQRLKQLREKLQSPATYEKAAAEVRAWGLLEKRPEPDAASSAPPPIAEPPTGGSDAGLLDQVLEQTGPSPVSAREPQLPPGLSELVRRAVEPYRLAKPDPERADLIRCVDAVAGQLMRSVLHDPRFQALESAWRGLAFLVRRLATGAKLRVFVLDVSRDELAADLGDAGKIESSAIYKLLVEQTVATPGADRWSAIAANYTFDAAAVDLLLAGCLAIVAARAGAGLVAGAEPGLIGCDSLAATPDPDDWRSELPPKVSETWKGIRALPQAPHLALVLPRFLLRAPYGPGTSPLESFDFDELPDPGAHEDFLWGNPSFACAMLLGQAFRDRGWKMRPEHAMTIDDLPVFGYDDEGEYRLKPCAEVLLSERAAERVLDAGLLPLLTVKGTGTARLAAWRSAHKDGVALAGPWR